MVKPTKRKAFNFLRSYFDVLNELKEDSDKLEFLMSIINKQFLNEDPTGLNFIARLCYESQRHAIESSVKGWERASNDTLSTTPPTTPPTTLLIVKQEEEEKEEEKEEEEVKKTKRFMFLNSLIDNGAKKELAIEWIKVRKNKKATNSETALKGFLSQVDKSNLNINQVLEQCVIRSWGGFNAEWVKDIKPQDVNIDKADVVTFYWEHEGRSNKRTISKDKAKDYFTKQAVGGYNAIVL